MKKQFETILQRCLKVEASKRRRSVNMKEKKTETFSPFSVSRAIGSNLFGSSKEVNFLNFLSTFSKHKSFYWLPPLREPSPHRRPASTLGASENSNRKYLTICEDSKLGCLRTFRSHNLSKPSHNYRICFGEIAGVWGENWKKSF